jgi:hypothetical protein
MLATEHPNLIGNVPLEVELLLYPSRIFNHRDDSGPSLVATQLVGAIIDLKEMILNRLRAITHDT